MLRRIMRQGLLQFLYFSIMYLDRYGRSSLMMGKASS